MSNLFNYLCCAEPKNIEDPTTLCNKIYGTVIKINRYHHGWHVYLVTQYYDGRDTICIKYRADENFDYLMTNKVFKKNIEIYMLNEEVHITYPDNEHKVCIIQPDKPNEYFHNVEFWYKNIKMIINNEDLMIKVNTFNGDVKIV